MDIMKWFREIPTGIDGIPLPQNRIDTLEQILLEKFNQDAVIESVMRLKSKKNTVVSLKITPKRLETTTLVAKMFIAGRFENELSILKSSWSHGLAVPEVLEAKDNVILMNFIPGETFVDRINRTFEPHLIDKLAKWYYNYHTAHKQIKGDPRLRNFICHDDQIFGVDFEESCSGPWMLDIAGVSASLLDTNPVFNQRKRVLSWRFLESYLSLFGKKRDESTDGEFISTLADILKQTSVWRENDRILDISEKIRVEGLPTD
ncbi:MAG: hypothetical protein KAU48_12780 [Candidatus Thorarchaeota archaeon]|nr:hypothetical protein [Candidatus Thorarchaeota archaeon]